MSAKASAVAVKGETAVTKFSEEALAALTGDEGHEGLDSEDFATPFLKLLQKGSPECDKGGEQYVDGAEAGMFWNTGSQTLYDPGEIRFLPVACQKCWIEWTPIEKGGGLVRQYAPGERPPNSTGQIKVELDSGNEVFLTHNHFGFAIDKEGDAEEVIFSCKSTQFTPSKKMNSALRSAKIKHTDPKTGEVKIRPLKRYANVVTFGSRRKENDFGSWHIFTWDNLRSINFEDDLEREWLRSAIAMHEMVASGDLKVTDEQLSRHQDGGGATPEEIVTDDSDIDF